MSETSPSSPPSFLSRIAPYGGYGVLLLAYGLLEWLALHHAVPGPGTGMGTGPLFGTPSPWNPSLGVVVAVLLVVGWRAIPALLLGLMATEVALRGSPPSWSALFLLTLIVVASYGTLTAALRHFGLVTPGLSRLRDVIFLGLGVCVGATVVAFGGAAIYLHAGLAARDNLGSLMYHLWLGDVVGVAVITPAVVLLWAALPLRRPAFPSLVLHAPQIFGPILGQGLALVATLVVVFLPLGLESFGLLYLLFLPLMWVAVKHGLPGAVAALVVIQAGLIAGSSLAGLGPESFIPHQTVMLVLSITGVSLGAVVSERRQAETRLLDQQNQLALVARLAVTGEMASALAHELNQPLLAAISYARAAQRVLDNTDVPPRAHDLINKAVGQAERAGEVIRGLRTFLRNAPPELTVTPPADLIHETLALVRADATYNGVSLVVDIPERLPKVLADRVQIEQVLLNLIHNSVESIAAANSPVRQVIVRVRLSPPDSIQFQVEDSGPGVVPDMVDRLYSPFATTKPAGMGLGLPICRSIVEAHGGRLWLDRDYAVGARFCLRLPAVASDPPSSTGGL